jgi:hypothetical protein
VDGASAAGVKRNDGKGNVTRVAAGLMSEARLGSAANDGGCAKRLSRARETRGMSVQRCSPVSSGGRTRPRWHLQTGRVARVAGGTERGRSRGCHISDVTRDFDSIGFQMLRFGLRGRMALATRSLTTMSYNGPWTAPHVRQTFFDYFASKDHKYVPSSSVVPHEDPTLLFANAGMNQVRDVATRKKASISNTFATVQGYLPGNRRSSLADGYLEACA